MAKVKFWTATITKGKQTYLGNGATEIEAKAAALREYERRTGKTGELEDFKVKTRQGLHRRNLPRFARKEQASGKKGKQEAKAKKRG